MKKSDKIFKQIENVRKKNNKNWMSILKLAYDVRPKETVKILNQIIRQNRLTDFEPVSLVNSVKKVELSS